MIHSPFKSLSVDNQALIHEGHFSLDLNCSHVEIYTGTVLLPRVHGIYWVSPKAMYSTKLKVYSAVFTVLQSGCREGLPPISFLSSSPLLSLVLHKVCSTMEDSPSLRGFKTFFFYFCTVHVSVCRIFASHCLLHFFMRHALQSTSLNMCFLNLHWTSLILPFFLHPFFLKVSNFLQWELLSSYL